MTRSIPAGRLIVAVLALFLPGCGSGEPTTITEVTRSTDTFMGSLGPRAAAYHRFSVERIGTIEVTLVSTAPSETVVLGIGIGQTAGDACIPAVIAFNNAAQTGTVLRGTIDIGSYCAA